MSDQPAWVNRATKKIVGLLEDRALLINLDDGGIDDLRVSIAQVIEDAAPRQQAQA